MRQTSIAAIKLVDNRANRPFTEVGPPVIQPVLDPLAAYTSTTVYNISQFLSD